MAMRFTSFRKADPQVISEQRLERAGVSVEGRAIKVSLRSGINDPTAPAAGMPYNLELTRGGKAK